MKFIACSNIIIINSILWLITTTTNGSNTGLMLFAKLNGNTPIAMELDVSSTIHNLKQQINKQLQSNGILTTQYQILHAGDDITHLQDDTHLSNLGISSEVTIDINTNTEPLKLNVTMSKVVYGYTKRNSQRGMYSDYNTLRYGSSTNALMNEFEVNIGTNTFFQDLETQIISWVKKEFGYTMSSKIPLIIILMVEGNEPVDYCPIYSFPAQHHHPRIITPPFVISTSHGYSRLELANSRSLTETTCVPIELMTDKGSRYNLINGYTTLNDLYELYYGEDKGQPGVFHFCKNPEDLFKSTRGTANLLNRMSIDLDPAVVRLWIPRECNIVFPHQSESESATITNRERPRRCEIM